ncbi:MAG: YjbH domain-containing protein [Rhodobacteraceae bacterium]|nr:YjbH domain-containing protein [Paracoccaceae bacterium]
MFAALLAGAGGTAMADTASLNSFGMPGLMDMPSAESTPDAQFSLTSGGFGGTYRNTMTFQISPRLTGGFRYTMIGAWKTPPLTTYLDRSFDLHYRLVDEGRYMPAISVGLRDFIGTGLYSSEYLVATKHLTRNLKVTAGLGWGRLGSYNGFRNPLAAIHPGFATRTGGAGLGGTPRLGNWFRGDAAFFGGVEWQSPNSRLSYKLEYSSDAYTREIGTHSIFVRRSPFNFGVDYRLSERARLSGYYMYGSELGFRVTMALNPKNSPVGGSLESAPTPVFVRPGPGEEGYELRSRTDWAGQSDWSHSLRDSLQAALAADRITILSAGFTATRVEVRIRNEIYGSAAQAIGRVARMMSRVLPLSVETFVITIVEAGMPVVSATIQRSDLEALENDPDAASAMLARVKLTDPVPMQGDIVRADGVYPHLNWRIGPYLRYSAFDPDNPLRADVGIRIQGKYDIAPGLSVSGSMTQKIVGNMDTVTRLSNSVLPHVRSDYGFYDKADLALEYLTADYLFRPGRNFYGRISLGYLERMYAGVSAEVLWKPVNSRFALGAEVNYVAQRSFNLGFGVQSYQIATGHISGYLDLRNGYTAQVDVGRYLAGDVGATFTVDREFANGWIIGAFFTLTDVPFTTFGEGSFDKGIRLKIPLSWTTGKPSKGGTISVIRPLSRDGGARLEIRNRLYETVRRNHRSRLEPAWGRFWR